MNIVYPRNFIQKFQILKHLARNAAVWVSIITKYHINRHNSSLEPSTNVYGRSSGVLARASRITLPGEDAARE